MLRSRLGMFAVILACAASATLAAPKNLIRLNEFRDDDSGPPLAILAADPVRAETAAAGANGSCRTVGDYVRVFSGTSRYRGNIYHIDADATLLGVEMELNIPIVPGGSTTLHFAIYEQDNASGVWTSLIGSRVINIIGVGRAFYPSDPLNVSLRAGFNYVMAFGWGADVAIAYGRDVLPQNTTYPGATPASFDIGNVLGRVGTVLTPPFPQSFANIGSANTAAHSMLLCLVPVKGACCSPSTTSCSQKFEGPCIGEAGAHFFGERTLCLDHVCDFGACCKPCRGECLTNYTTEACTAAGGIQHWTDATCPVDASSLCPPVTGACCGGDGTCSEVCATDCVGDGVVYHGDGSSCDTNPCVGACCLPGAAIGCTELTVAVCSSLGGATKGLGTTCDNLSPADECGGACCWGFGSSLSSCRHVDNRVDCSVDALPGGQQAYLGDATVCGAPCGVLATDYGACCMPDATCIDMPGLTECTLAGGSFSGLGQTCEFNVQCVREPCCLPDGVCETMTSAACIDRGGVPQTGTACPEGGCAVAACCESDEGRCTVMTPAACLAANGLPGLDGTNCDAPATVCNPSLEFGACCVGEAICLDTLTETECRERVGIPLPDPVLDKFFVGQTCADLAANDQIPDCDQRGACCTQTGTCLFITATKCEAIVGTFTIADRCDANSCLSGACCHDGGCSVTGETFCRRIDGLAGFYKGNATVCNANTCIPSGACCVSGTCNADQRPADCTTVGGIYLGDDSPCTDNVCALGTCCNHGTCTDAQTATECIPIDPDPGVVFRPGAFCFQNPCERFGACCFGSGDCVDDWSQTICETENGTFSNNLLCTQVNCEPVGPCCFRDGTCLDSVAQSTCVAQTGTLSIAASCTAVICEEIGACCLRNGSCENDITRTDCEERRGTSTPDFTCGQIPLCEPLGACCMPVTEGFRCFDDLSPGACETQGGTYRGDETNCPADGSTCGSCCSLTGCVDGRMSTECVPTDQEEDFKPGILCAARGAEAVCVARGACCPLTGGCLITDRENCEIFHIGTYAGDGATCEGSPELCVVGACCDVFLPGNEKCILRTEINCKASEGKFYQGPGTTCSDQSICTVGSCCPATGFDDCFGTTVLSECGIAEDFRPGQETCLFCEGRGACCLADNVACQVLPESECLGAGGSYHGNDTTCPGPEEVDDVCFVGACCNGLRECANKQRFDCETGGGLYGGVGVTCDPNPCPKLDSATPESCTIDPAQPSNPDGSGVAGVSSITLNYSANVFGLTIDDFAIAAVPGILPPPSVAGFTISGKEITFDFDAPIPFREWTCITDLFYGGRVCVAALPGDVDVNRVPTSEDVAALLADLQTPALPAGQCDIDRSGACSPLDILREIDLLIGAEGYNIWRSQTIPACPTAP